MLSYQSDNDGISYPLASIETGKAGSPPRPELGSYYDISSQSPSLADVSGWLSSTGITLNAEIANNLSNQTKR